jgi:hypothetical protein
MGIWVGTIPRITVCLSGCLSRVEAVRSAVILGCSFRRGPAALPWERTVPIKEAEGSESATTAALPLPLSSKLPFSLPLSHPTDNRYRVENGYVCVRGWVGVAVCGGGLGGHSQYEGWEESRWDREVWVSFHNRWAITSNACILLSLHWGRGLLSAPSLRDMEAHRMCVV